MRNADAFVGFMPTSPSPDARKGSYRVSYAGYIGFIYSQTLRLKDIWSSFHQEWTRQSPERKNYDDPIREELVHFAGTVVQGDGKVDVTYDDLLKAGWSVVLAALSTLPRQVDSMQPTGVAEM